MSAKSTTERYGSVAIAFHWTTALAVLVTWAIGISLDKFSPTPPALLVTHIVLGVTVLLLTLGRILWWLFADRRRPGPVADEPRAQQIAARIVHGLLYALLILLPLSGIATAILAGLPQTLASGGTLPSLEDIPTLRIHTIEGLALIALAVGHVGAALYHQVLRRDRLLARMGIGAA